MNEISVQMRYVSVEYERPPLALVYFNVSLCNLHTEARWFLFPDVEPTHLNQPYAIDTAETYELIGQGRVIVGHFSGSRGFFAVQLPPKAQVTMQNFPIRFMDEYPPHFDLEIIQADELRINDEPPEAWLGMKTISDAHAIVSADELADQREVVFVRETPDFHEVNVMLREDERAYIKIDTTG